MLAGVRWAQGSPGEKDPKENSPGMGVAPLFCRESLVLPHCKSGRGLGGATRLGLALPFLQKERETPSEVSSGSVISLFSKNCFHVQTPPSRCSTGQPQSWGRGCGGGLAGLLTSPGLLSRCAGKSQGLCIGFSSLLCTFTNKSIVF